MQHSFEYMFTEQPMDTFDIENIGDVCLNMLNDTGAEWYLLIETESGFTKIRRYGPLQVDSNTISGSFVYSYQRIEYKEPYLIKYIDKCLNKDLPEITQVFEIDKETFNDRLKDLVEEDF